jgi:transcriptional regulator with XRE-family HTH domain
MLDDLNTLSQVTKNLRYRLYGETHDYSKWEEILSKRAGISLYRAQFLIGGEPPTDEEIQKLADWCGVSSDDLCSAPIHPADAEGILRENMKFLMESLPHGGKTALAKALKMTGPQISRWASGEHLPHQSNIENLKDYFGISPRVDLRADPIFLTNAPIHGEAKREYLLKQIQEAPPWLLDDHFASFEKLLRKK